MSPTRTFSRLALIATLLLVTIGGFTRGSNSGYGCEDRWPLCENGLLGGLLPRGEFHMIVEWTHRWVAATVGFLAIAVAFSAWRHHRHERRLTYPAIGAVVVILIQAWVGRLVVKGDLAGDLVTLHLTISMAILGLLTMVVVASSTQSPPSSATNDRAWRRFLGVGAAVALMTVLLGSYVHNLSISGWPFVGNRIFPDLSNLRVAVHFLHRVMAGVGYIYLSFLSFQAVRRERSIHELRLVHGAMALFLLNIALGAAHVFTRVSSSALVAAHLAVASLVWVFLVAATAMVNPQPAELIETS